jgi:hypothetical protein
MFLDQKPDEKRLQLASALKITIVIENKTGFILLDPYGSHLCLRKIFTVSPAPFH